MSTSSINPISSTSPNVVSDIGTTSLVTTRISDAVSGEALRTLQLSANQTDTYADQLQALLDADLQAKVDQLAAMPVLDSLRGLGLQGDEGWVLLGANLQNSNALLREFEANGISTATFPAVERYKLSISVILPDGSSGGGATRYATEQEMARFAAMGAGPGAGSDAQIEESYNGFTLNYTLHLNDRTLTARQSDVDALGEAAAQREGTLASAADVEGLRTSSYTRNMLAILRNRERLVKDQRDRDEATVDAKFDEARQGANDAVRVRRQDEDRLARHVIPREPGE
jgi:hypothetical protein